VIGDSLALPRETASIRYRDSYPFLIQQSLNARLAPRFVPIVYDRSRPCLTLPDVVRRWDEEIAIQDPDVVVIHAGVVDCAPRVFTPFQRRVLTHLRPKAVRTAILRLVRRYRRQLVTLRGGMTYSTLDEFRSAAMAISERVAHQGLRACFFVSILSPPPTLEYRSPGFAQNVVMYNAVLDEAAQNGGIQVVSMNELVQTYGYERVVLDDGIHISQFGHAVLAAALSLRIAQAVTEERSILTVG